MVGGAFSGWASGAAAAAAADSIGAPFELELGRSAGGRRADSGQANRQRKHAASRTRRNERNAMAKTNNLAEAETK